MQALESGCKPCTNLRIYLFSTYRPVQTPGGPYHVAGRGAGFSRFLSPAVGGGESRTADGPCPATTQIGKDLMSTDTQKNFEMESVLRSLINTLQDSQKGFADIGEHLKDETLKRYFLAESLKRANFRGELENELHRHGIADVNETGTTTGKLYRVWGDLKAKLGGGDHTLLETAEQAEDTAKDAYADALRQELPLPLHQLLSEQQAHVLTSHDYVRDHRDALATAK